MMAVSLAAGVGIWLQNYTVEETPLKYSYIAISISLAAIFFSFYVSSSIILDRLLDFKTENRQHQNE
jgi:hypothetical protein